MKYVLLLGLLAFVCALIYWRLRPYIQTARRIFAAVRDLRLRSSTPGENADLPRRGNSSSRNRQSAAPGEKLVRCATCGTWLPASRAISLLRSSPNARYCSHACLERAADNESRRAARRPAS